MKNKNETRGIYLGKRKDEDFLHASLEYFIALHAVQYINVPKDWVTQFLSNFSE